MQSVIPRPPCSISTFSDRVHLQKREQARSPTESGKELEGCLPSAAIAGICGATIVAASAVKRPSLRHRPGAWRLGLSRRVSLCASTAERQVLEEAALDTSESSSSPRPPNPEADNELDKQILGLALPALVSLCAEPLLSITDTAIIGRLPDAALSLGGLGVATSVFDTIFRGFNFLCVVTVPLVAQAAVARSKGDASAPDPAVITGRVIGLAACLGLATLALLLLNVPAALQLGGAVPGSELGNVAAIYLGVRAFALPASLVNTVAVGAFRGNLDTATPLQVVFVQVGINVVLDIALVFGVATVGVPALGVQGAAVATTAAIWTACALFCALLTARGLVKWEAALSWPLALAELQPLLVGSFWQLVRTVALSVVLVEFVRSAAALDSTGLAAAAHQVAIRTWFLALFALDSIAVAAQALVPTSAADGGPKEARKVAERLLTWGAAGGLLCAIVLAVFGDAVPGVFTDNVEVQDAARPFIFVVAALQPLAGLVFTWDGIFQGLSDYAYLARAMAVASIASVAFLQAPALQLSESLGGIWVCFSLFLLFRGLGVAWRYLADDGPLSTPQKELQ
eukprot:TRINITY_DN34322_c0_g1_i4.p1 TRINITY_DN34322_c0_g1~~TRINITY_DN34322_c0_g1_i4.p1  ORF type:complete len:572 (+),score=93.93 TRINITY_DN34322_c0_g1_i4:142-1857(+)